MRAKLSDTVKIKYEINDSTFKMPYLIYGDIDYQKNLEIYRSYEYRLRGNFARGTMSKTLRLNLDY